MNTNTVKTAVVDYVVAPLITYYAIKGAFAVGNKLATVVRKTTR